MVGSAPRKVSQTAPLMKVSGLFRDRADGLTFTAGQNRSSVQTILVGNDKNGSVGEIGSEIRCNFLTHNTAKGLLD